MSDAKSIEKLTFEEAMSELESIVNKIDNGEADLASSVKHFERAVLLQQYCSKLLNNAEQKIQKIVQKNDNIVIEDAQI